MQDLGTGVAGRADDRHLDRPVERRSRHREPPAGEAGVLGRQHRDGAEGRVRRLPVPAGAGQGRVRQQGPRRGVLPRGGGVVRGVLRPLEQPLGVVGGVVEAARPVGEPVEQGVQQRARQPEPAGLPGRPVEGDQPFGEVGVVLQHSRVRARPAVARGAQQPAVRHVHPLQQVAAAAAAASRGRAGPAPCRSRPGPRWRARSSRPPPCRRVPVVPAAPGRRAGARARSPAGPGRRGPGGAAGRTCRARTCRRSRRRPRPPTSRRRRRAPRAAARASRRRTGPPRPRCRRPARRRSRPRRCAARAAASRRSPGPPGGPAGRRRRATSGRTPAAAARCRTASSRSAAPPSRRPRCSGRSRRRAGRRCRRAPSPRASVGHLQRVSVAGPRVMAQQELQHHRRRELRRAAEPAAHRVERPRAGSRSGRLRASPRRAAARWAGRCRGWRTSTTFAPCSSYGRPVVGQHAPDRPCSSRWNCGAGSRCRSRTGVPRGWRTRSSASRPAGSWPGWRSCRRRPRRGVPRGPP